MILKFKKSFRSFRFTYRCFGPKLKITHLRENKPHASIYSCPFDPSDYDYHPEKDSQSKDGGLKNGAANGQLRFLFISSQFRHPLL